MSCLSILTLGLAVLAQPRSTDDALAQRIERIENGLLPRIVPKGKLGVTMSLVNRMRDQNVPGLSVAVINDGVVEWARGYGAAESGTDRRVTPEMLFQAGSISKPVAAVGALTLVAAGKLSLDGDVNTVLKSWQVPPSELLRDRKVTLRGLLSHSAGLTVHGFPGYARGAPCPTLVEVLDGKSPANTAAIRVDLLPGLQWRYSGGGYTVMQQMVIDVTGETFPDFMQHAVLAPAGMTHSTYRQPLPDELAALTAAGHVGGGKVEGQWHIYPEMAAAGLWTTPTDLAMLAIAVQEAATGTSDLLDADLTLEMLTLQKGSFGLGFALAGTGENDRFSHGGRDEGFDATLVAYARQGKGAAIMINANNNEGLMEELLASIAREYQWPDYPTDPQRER